MQRRCGRCLQKRVVRLAQHGSKPHGLLHGEVHGTQAQAAMAVGTKQPVLCRAAPLRRHALDVPRTALCNGDSAC